MMQSRLHFLFPGPLGRRSGGTIYDTRMIAALRALGHDVAAHELPGRFPLVDESARAAARRALACVRPGDVVVVDGLALDALDARAWPMAAACVPLLHTPVEELRGPTAPSLATLVAGEEAWLRRADRIIVTSEHSAERLVRRGVAAWRIGVVEPGVDRGIGRRPVDFDGRAVAVRGPTTLGGGRRPEPGAYTAGDGRYTRAGLAAARLLAVGAVTAVKGHAVLVRALGRLRHLRWRLRVVGSTHAEPETWREVQEEIARHDLFGRIRFVGELPPHRMPHAFRDADIFVLPSLYESYGMALAEAAAAGLALVAAAAGAVPTTPAGRAAVLAPPGDAEALARALEPVIRHAGLRQRLGAAAREAAAGIATWDEAGQRFATEVWGHAPEPAGGSQGHAHAYT